MTTTVDLLDSIRAHLAEFELPELYSVNVTRSFSGPNVTAQLACHTPPQIASALLAWADTLTGVTVEAWRVETCPPGEGMFCLGHVAFGDVTPLRQRRPGL